MSGVKKGITLRDRLEAKRKILPNGCWKWTGLNTAAEKKFHKNHVIYGWIKSGQKSLKVHRAAWTVYRGAIPAGQNVLHECDFGLCFNPDHLFLGTQKQNMEDCSRKGRIPIGERNSRSVLTDKMVRSIRRFYKPFNRSRTHRAIAKKFGIGKTIVGDVIRRKRWSHVK